MASVKLGTLHPRLRSFHSLCPHSHRKCCIGNPNRGHYGDKLDVASAGTLGVDDSSRPLEAWRPCMADRGIRADPGGNLLAVTTTFRAFQAGTGRLHPLRVGFLDNNRKAKFYSLTPAGRKQLRKEARDWVQTAAIMERFLRVGRSRHETECAPPSRSLRLFASADGNARWRTN